MLSLKQKHQGFGFHHIPDKGGMISAVFRVQRPGRRDTNSQLQAISDRAYEDGLRRLERDVAAGAQRVRADHLCLVTIRGDRN